MLLLTEKAEVFASGSNEFGQLGVGSSTGTFQTVDQITVLSLLPSLRIMNRSSERQDVERK